MADSPEHELTIFSAARQLPPERLAAYLDQACAGNADLRRRIEELLQTNPKAAAFLETPAWRLGAAAGPAPAPAEKPGDRIGRYQLIEQIGEGGCGIVYLASQEEPVKRQVALKVIKLGMDTKSVIARFEAERQALALMDHANIAKVLDAGATDAGRPYFVMELVRGIKITDCCDQNQFSTHQRLELFLQVCSAIQHAHQKGIIHRDIKPSNILVAMQDGVPVPKVIDFGIAKATSGRLTDHTYFTAFEQFIGTPAYMSPEQAEARAVDVDTRSDIYSLGVLLYELLTGQTPFDARELMQAGLDEIRRTIREQEPANPSTKLSTLQGPALGDIARQRRTEAPQLVHQVRGDLDWIVMKALEKDRARRYETANGFAADIRRHLHNEPVAARPPSNAYRFQKWARRNRLIFAAGSGIALALALGVAISVWALIREHEARLEADRQRAQALVNEQKAVAESAKNRQVAQFLEDMLNGVGPSVAMGSDTTLLKKILDNTANRISTDLAGQPEVEAELCYTLGEVYWELGDLENAAAMHRQALDLRLKALGAHDPQVAQSMGRLAHVLWRQGKLTQAEDIARGGVELQRELFGSTNLDVARSLEDYAAILNTLGRPISTEAALREAVATKETLLGQTNFEVADSLDDLGYWLLSRRYKQPEAENLAWQAIQIREKLLGTNNLLVTVSRLKLQAAAMDVQGNASEQAAALKQLITAQHQLYGEIHPSLAQSLNTLASVLRNNEKLAESESLRRQALAMQEKLLGPETPEVAQTLVNLGELLVAEKKLDEAEPAYRRALAINRKVLGDDTVIASTSMIGLGDVLVAENKFDEAHDFYLGMADGSSICARSAQYSLGLMSLHGRGVPRDTAEGVRWLNLAAEHNNTRAQIDLATLYFEGKEIPRDEKQSLEWFYQAAKLGNAAAMPTLANCYCAVGRSREAIATLKAAVLAHPRGTDDSLTLATWEAWFGQTTNYENTRRTLVLWATTTDSAAVKQSAAKAYCLQPCDPGAALLLVAQKLAESGLAAKKGTVSWGWYQLTYGMVQYRTGDYTNAAQTLAQAEQNAGKYTDILPPALCFRAMCLFQLGQNNEARQLFDQARADMPPLPSEPQRPLVNGKLASHDVIIGWLATREAAALLKVAN